MTTAFTKLSATALTGVREPYRKLLGEFETDEGYAERFALIARSLGAKKAYVV